MNMDVYHVACMYYMYYNCDFHGLLSHFQKKINMARGLEQGNMKHFVVSPAGDFLAFQGRILTTSAAIKSRMTLLTFIAAVLNYFF